MSLADIIRAVIPHRMRITVGRWSIDQASRSWTTLAWYLSQRRMGTLLVNEDTQ